MQVGNHDDAVRDYTTALALQPDSIVARFNRSTVLDAVGRHAEAVADLDAVVRADPDNADAWHNRGVARSHMVRSAVDTACLKMYTCVLGLCVVGCAFVTVVFPLQR